MSKKFPLLASKSVRVLPFEQRHLTPHYVSWLNDPEVVQFSEQRHYTHTLATCTQYFEAMQESTDFFLAIEAVGESFSHIGNIGVSFDLHNAVADVSIMVGEKRVWGRGHATAAWNAVLFELLKNQGIRKVVAGTMAVNEPMIRLMKRSGMHVESTRCRHFIWEGKEVDMVQAALFFDNILKMET